MSMTVITAFQLLGILCAYLVITFFGPHFVLGKTKHYRNRYERFLFYFLIGNFYVIYLVYFLELLHISNRFTLILFTIVPAIYIKARLEEINILDIVKTEWDLLRQLFGGQLKVRAYRDSRKLSMLSKREEFRKTFCTAYLRNWVDVILTISTVGTIFWAQGLGHLYGYGFKSYDSFVHTYWINELSNNNIFAGGVYPFGFHCLLYYIHAVFGIDTYVLIRLTAFVTVMWVNLVLLCVLKLILKAKYIPYIGVFLYSVSGFFQYATYGRFSASLPQEHGMIYILPTIYCGLYFFKMQKQEIHGSAMKKPYRYLVGYVIGFALTLTTHFYGIFTVIIFAIAAAIGFGRLFLSKVYFKRVFFSTILALLIAIMPLGLSAITGTRLEGSLYWALSIISVSEDSEKNDEVIDETIEEVEGQTATEENKKTYIFDPALIEEYGPIVGPIVGYYTIIRNNSKQFTVRSDIFPYSIQVIFITIPMMFLCGIMAIVTGKNRWYGSTLVSCSLFLLFMIIVSSASSLHLVAIMDASRASIYLAYSIAFAFPISIDGILYLLTGMKIRKAHLYGFVSLIISISFISLSLKYGIRRNRITFSGYELNGAMECLTKIIRNDEDYQWTIVSANDEGRMVFDHGYHYETITFLRRMEYLGDNEWTRIPTPTVYFYIEKYPIDYYLSWEGSGTAISQEEAKKDLPEGYSLVVYEGENRWICMSRMYEWICAFKKMYPNEVSVFYEDEDFVCYRVEQNPYRLFNFAIDYGYNDLGRSLDSLYDEGE